MSDLKIIEMEGRREASGIGRPPAFSDDALALSFADRHSGDLRYVAALGKWLHWTGKRWRQDEILMARQCARLICRAASADCNTKARNIIAGAKTVSGVERLAQADPRLAATLDQWDVDPWLLNTPNETIDLRTGDGKPHDPADYLTKVTGIAPAGRDPIPTWQSFLDRITDNNVELQKFLQRMAGYSLTGSTKEYALFFLYGLGANGKTTFLNALIACLDDYHCMAPIETFTASNHDRHPTEHGDANMLSRVASQLHTNLELTGKLLGDLGVGVTNVNVLVMPAYVELRVALVQALASFPEARQAVATVLHQLESKAADAIARDDKGLAK